MSTKVMLVAAHALIREGIKQLLEFDGSIDVIEQASDGAECLENLQHVQPDILLLDINMPNVNGIEVLEEIKNEKSSVYRMDGDHFGVNLAGCSKRETVDFFERLQKRTESMCEFSGGAVCYPYNENEKDMSALVSYAENALMQSKKNGKNRLSFFSSDDYKENASRMELLKELRESIRNNFEGFELYYQLQVTSN